MGFYDLKEIPDYELKEPFYVEGKKWTSRFNYELEKPENHRESVTIYDVTLRDGDQTPDSACQEDERVRIADQLAALKVPRIEAGMPMVSKAVENAMRTIAKRGYKDTKVYAFTRAAEVDIDLALDIGVDGVVIEYTVNPIFIKHAYQKTPAEMIDMLTGAINKAKAGGLDVAFMGWDWFRAPLEFTTAVMDELVARTKLDGVVIVDTFGCATPDVVYEMFKIMKERYPGLRLEFHGHNDIGCGVANCLAAMWGGAEVLHTAMNGMGERCGNVPTEELATLLEIHKGIDTKMDLSQIALTCELVSKMSNVPFYDTKPIMGTRMMKMEPGVAMDVTWKLENNDKFYCTNSFVSVTPSVFGRKEDVKFVLGKSSGKNSIRLIASYNGINDLTDEEVDKLTDMVVEEGLVTKHLVSDAMFLDFIASIRENK
ncbi:MAG: hypothetical protein IJ132_00010 [Firmicutes bacterium]|nr:hypothetical protein [Bacillota bacterium]